MGSSVKELAEELKNLGQKLFIPPAAKDDLLNLLDQAEKLLSTVEQAPPSLIKDRILLISEALSDKALLDHLDMGVKVTTLSCITEITRITAPDAPFEDELMKGIFQLTAEAFEKLSHVAGRCYSKAVTVLTNVARIKLPMVMLDLDCQECIVKMFHTFLKVIRSNHPIEVFSSMESIMTSTLEESEEISLELVYPLLDSVKKENQRAASWKLGNQVIENCGDLLKPCIIMAMHSTSIAVDDYAGALISICQDVSNKRNVNGSVEDLETENMRAEIIDVDHKPQVVNELVQGAVCKNEVDPTVQTSNDNSRPTTIEPCQAGSSGGTGIDPRNANSTESRKMKKSESQPETIPKKRGRKPNSLMMPDEGYDNSWIGSEGRGHRVAQPRRRRSRDMNSPRPKNSASKHNNSPLEHVKIKDSQDSGAQEVQGEIPNSPPDGRSSGMGRRKRKDLILDQEMSAPNVASGTPLEGKDVAPTTASLKQDCDERSVTKGKQGKRQRKGALAVNSDVNASPDQVDKVKGNESGISGGPENKSLMQSVVKVDTRSINKKDSSVHVDGKKRRRRVKLTSGNNIAERSGEKEIESKPAISSKKDESHLDGSLHKKVKRKRTPGKDEASRRANDINNLDGNLVGRMVKVWWPMDKRFYEGVVSYFDPSEKKHQVLYVDGDEELLNLNEELWELIPDDSSAEEDYNIDFATPNASSSLQKKKKSKLGHSSKQPKAKSTSKRTQANKPMDYKTRTVAKSAKNSTLDTSVDESEDEAFENDENSAKI